MACFPTLYRQHSDILGGQNPTSALVLSFSTSRLGDGLMLFNSRAPDDLIGQNAATGPSSRVESIRLCLQSIGRRGRETSHRAQGECETEQNGIV
jgi:hypothetical protein